MSLSSTETLPGGSPRARGPASSRGSSTSSGSGGDSASRTSSRASSSSRSSDSRSPTARQWRRASSSYSRSPQSQRRRSREYHRSSHRYSERFRQGHKSNPTCTVVLGVMSGLLLGGLVGLVGMVIFSDFDNLMAEEPFGGGRWYAAPLRSWKRRGQALQELSNNAWSSILSPDLSVTAGQARMAPWVAVGGIAGSALLTGIGRMGTRFPAYQGFSEFAADFRRRQTWKFEPRRMSRQRHV